MAGKFARTPGAFHLPRRLSYSSLSDYADCGEQWRLARGLKLGQDFAWWANVGGSAVHEMTELVDRIRIGQLPEDYELPTFEQLMDKCQAEYDDAGLEIRASGYERAELQWTGGPNKKGRDWWLVYGPKMVDAYERWIGESGWEIIAVEHPFEVVIDGEPRIGHIDRVMVTPEGVLYIVDLKTGKEVLGRLQLGTYRAGYREDTGLDADRGAFLSFNVPKGGVPVEKPVLDADGNETYYVRGPRKGQVKTETVKVEGEVYAYLSGDTDFSIYSDEYVQNQYAMMRRGLEAGIFIPNTRNCGTCPVRDYCRAVDGRLSPMVPITSVILPPKEEQPAEELVGVSSSEAPAPVG
jgi:hypothetical protein